VKGQIELWVRLKVVDLVAQTAWMTLTEKLDFGDSLLGLVRYSYWGLSVEGDGGAAALCGEVDRVIRADSTFTNQNKHRYSLIVSAARGSVTRGDLDLGRDFAIGDGTSAGSGTGGAYLLDCLVRERDASRTQRYRDRLNERLDGVRVEQCTAGEIWRFVVRSDSAANARETAERMLVTRSRTEGLILNPHYQEFEIVSVTKVEREEGVR
jgi:hypothetical protein